METYELKKYRIFKSNPSLPKGPLDMKYKVYHLSKTVFEVDLIGGFPGLTNSYRSIMLAQVPTMAISRIEVFQNNSDLLDEVLYKRLGLLPIDVDPEIFEIMEPNSQGVVNDSIPEKFNFDDTLILELKESCSYSDTQPRQILAKHVQWVPLENQKQMNFQFKFLEENIPIVTLYPGDSIEVVMYCHKSIGKDDIKYSPQACVVQRWLMEVTIKEKITGENAHKLAKVMKGVIGVKEVEGEDVAVVVNTRAETGTRNHFFYPELEDKIQIVAHPDHIIYKVESVGVIPATDIFKRALKISHNGCTNFIEQLKKQKKKEIVGWEEERGLD